MTDDRSPEPRARTRNRQLETGSRQLEAGSAHLIRCQAMIPWILVGYALGSVPFAFILARRAGIDVRVAGSGNVGAANVLRTSGTPLGVMVMSLDILKGVATVMLASALQATTAAMAAAGAA